MPNETLETNRCRESPLDIGQGVCWGSCGGARLYGLPVVSRPGAAKLIHVTFLRQRRAPQSRRLLQTADHLATGAPGPRVADL